MIGTRSIILPGVSLGRGSVVAAGAVVARKVDALSVVAGVPAKQIKKRSSDFDYKTEYRRIFQ